MSVCLLHIAQRSFWVYARVFTPRCVFFHGCLCVLVCLFVCIACVPAYLLMYVCACVRACMRVCALRFQGMYLCTSSLFEDLKMFGPVHQTALLICLVEAEVQFKASNLQMCENRYGFYILYCNNADIPSSCAYLASLVQSLF